MGGTEEKEKMKFCIYPDCRWALICGPNIAPRSPLHCPKATMQFGLSIALTRLLQWCQHFKHCIFCHGGWLHAIDFSVSPSLH